jgi:hypothetical protein
MSGWYLTPGHSRSFHILSNSLFSNHPKITQAGHNTTAEYDGAIYIKIRHE